MREFCWSRNAVVKGFIQSLIREGMTDPGHLEIMARTFVRTPYFKKRVMEAPKGARTVIVLRDFTRKSSDDG